MGQAAPFMKNGLPAPYRSFGAESIGILGGWLGWRRLPLGAQTHGRHRDVTQNPPGVMRQIFPTATHGATQYYH